MIIKFQLSIPTTKELKREIPLIKNSLDKKLIKLDTWAFNHYGSWFWKLMYRMRGKCGNYLWSHYPVFGNMNYWIWKRVDSNTFVCSVCGKVEKSNPYTGSFKNYARQGREEDMNQLIDARKHATNDAERLSIDKAMYNINHEDAKVRSMRESLIKATREHEHDKIRDIHEYVGEKKQYRREVV